jgi:hypothetical protein
MSTPDQVFDHRLNPLKGWPSPYAVDKSANLSDSVTAADVRDGMVLSLNASGEFALGLAANAMPIFALNDGTDFDVNGDDGNVFAGKGAAQAKMSGLVAVGGFEIETTEFDTTGTYLPNQALTSPAPGDTDAGKVKPGTFYEDTICAVVSDGESTDAHKNSVVRCWPYFLPELDAYSSENLA